MTAPFQHKLQSLATSVRLLGRNETNVERVAMSSRTNSREHSWSKQEILTYRQFFKYRMKTFFRENYEGPAHIADVWKVDPTTALNWWEGLSAPQSWVLGMAIDDPEIEPEVKKFLSRNTSCESYAAE